MKLTGRQRDFLGALDCLQREGLGDPIHYSTLAERLDIANISAYNMLRVLEDKGCVQSRYQLPEVRIGRSSIVFEISDTGREILASFAAHGNQ